MLCTEQNPSALGNTASGIDISYASAVIPKTSFSMCCVPELKQKLNELGEEKIDTIVIFGLEVSINSQKYTLIHINNKDLIY